jgi:hypothetical protein
LAGLLVSCHPQTRPGTTTTIASVRFVLVVAEEDALFGQSEAALELEPRVIVRGAGGFTKDLRVGPGFVADGLLDLGQYAVRVTSRCGDLAPESDVIISARDAGEPLRIQVPVLPTAERFVSEATRARLFGGASDEFEIPPNSSVRFLRPWPDASGRCEDALVEALDVGGIVYGGTRVIVPAKMLVDSPPTATTPAAYVAQSLQDIADEEMRTGQCGLTSQYRLETHVELFLAGNRLVGQAEAFVVATPSGGTTQLTVDEGGETYFVGLGPDLVTLSVVDPRGRVRDLDAELRPIPGMALLARTVAARDRETFSATVTGEGCAAVLVAKPRRE